MPETYDAAVDLAGVLVDASYACAESFRTFIDESFEESESSEKHEQLVSEFFFAFLHMLDRTMLAERGVDFRDQNIDPLATLALRERASRQHPALNANVMETFLVLLGRDANDAHSAYSNCSSDPDQPFTGNGVMNRLAPIVCRYLDCPNNPELHRQAISEFAHFSEIVNLRNVVTVL
ncbi:MAG TPA: hypothetical protein VNN25_22855 [Thermoanaerobaculia bacterium]|nr:hypothetical protein [Thermoanaerobaculia bacterium]